MTAQEEGRGIAGAYRQATVGEILATLSCAILFPVSHPFLRLHARDCGSLFCHSLGDGRKRIQWMP
jgi:hypothetical protein